MKIWYLDHSGFAVETAEHFLIFDYYRDLPRGGKLCDGVINPEELAGRKVVVFASHAHDDHYNPVIFDWRETVPDIRYLLSDDIHTRPGAEMIGPEQTRDLGDLRVRTLSSTDQGVAFLVDCDGVCIYHAGDLNWWHWNGESDHYNDTMARDYKAQIALLGDRKIDVAFLPVDPRLEDKYALGLDWFMRTVGAELAVPMHFWEDRLIFDRLRKDPLTQHYRHLIAAPFGRGDQVYQTEQG